MLIWITCAARGFRNDQWIHRHGVGRGSVLPKELSSTDDPYGVQRRPRMLTVSARPRAKCRSQFAVGPVMRPTSGVVRSRHRARHETMTPRLYVGRPLVIQRGPPQL